MKVEKDTLFRFLRRLNKELSNKMADLKGDFEKNPPPNNEIKKRFMVPMHSCRNGALSMTNSLSPRSRRFRRSMRRASTSRTLSSKQLRSSAPILIFWYDFHHVGASKERELIYRRPQRLYSDELNSRPHHLRDQIMIILLLDFKYHQSLLCLQHTKHLLLQNTSVVTQLAPNLQSEPFPSLE